VEAAERSADKLKQMEESDHELRARLLAAEQAEIRVAELTDLLKKAQAELKRLPNDSAKDAGIPPPVSAGQTPTKPKAASDGEAVTAPVEVALEPTPAIAVAAAPVEPTSAASAGEKLGPVPDESSPEHLTATPAPLVIPTETHVFTAESSPPPTSDKVLPEVTAITSVSQSKKSAAKRTNRKKGRRDGQIDLFEGQNVIGQMSAEDPKLPATEIGPASATAPAHRSPAQQSVNPAHLRKAMNEILPLLADKDPGAKDCLKANRTIFHSAFSPEAYEEFEQSVKRGDFDPALEHLKKAARKHGISL
jgi:hypothetical protein